MAGLQQYNFFPTDLFYPRPQPQPQPQPQPPPANLETSSGKATVPSQKTPSGADRNQPQQQQPTVAWKLPPTLAYKQRRHSLNWVSKKKSKFSFNPLCLLTWAEEEEEENSDSF
ncbi:hypothetical protein L6164_034177 [Bauhinia variegata]|uniref:Uncharacterized protein n=1 Tax=Bauhinia variegata TaxID=167791 RepID=A0ACB9KU19_BAUVA|nr:hypothetical protein L6164_034177 [Bauhinia variegata]